MGGSLPSLIAFVTILMLVSLLEGIFEPLVLCDIEPFVANRFISSAFDALMMSRLVRDTPRLPFRLARTAGDEPFLGETGAVSKIPDCCVKAKVLQSDSLEFLRANGLLNFSAEMVAL